MKEANWIVDGQPAPACLIDVGLFLYHNARELVARGSGPYLYLPKLETEHEAWMWNRLFGWVETELGLSHGTIRCTVLVETLPGLLRLEPIVWSLRERLTGLNVGRWDYLFSCIKVMSRDRSHVLPDRSRLTMDRPELVEYARWVVHVAHRRGAHAIGGMAADVPSRRDPEVTRRALAVVKSDKEREASLGHDGTWVAHPDLVEVARRTFDRVLRGRVEQRDVVPGFDELDVELVMCGGNERVTESGVRDAVRTALVYVDAWMSGNGCVAMGGKMEDAATAEISRALLWQWVDRGVVMEDGRRVTLDMVTAVVRGEAAALAAAGTAPRIEAVEVVWRSVASSTPPEFITTEASCVSFQPMLVS